MNADLIVSVKNLSKSYGAIEAVRHLNLELQVGERFGLIGPDGAGKTTILRILCGLLLPQQGEVRVLDFDPLAHPDRIKDGIGYMPQRFSLYPDLTVAENLRFFADIYRVPTADRNRLTRRLLEFSRLGPFSERKAGALSGGMKQKLALSCTLIHTPKLLILDEPTTGVDPVSRAEFWDILDDLRQQGITALVTTPYMDEAARCDRIALMHQGQILARGTPAEVTDSFPDHIIRVYTPQPQQAAEILRRSDEFPSVQLFGDRAHVVVQEPSQALGRIRQILTSAQHPFTAIEIGPAELEDVFVYLASQPKADGQMLSAEC